MTQTIVTQRDHLLYVVDIRSQTPGMPYGDTFALVTRYCITWVSRSSCQLLVTCGIEWIKSAGMLKSIIQSNAIKGLQEGLQIEQQSLENQVRPGGASATKIDKTKKGQSMSKSSLPDFGLLKYQKIILILLCCVLVWSAVLNLVSFWRFSSHFSKHAFSMNKDRLRVESWLKESEFLRNDGQDFKHTFLQSHFRGSNVSDTLLSYEYHNATKAKVYQALQTSHEKALKKRQRLERQLVLIEKIEATSLFAMYENWLLDQSLLNTPDGRNP
jgi:hypothetical protein